MPAFRCEFDVMGDLVLPTPSFVIRFTDSCGMEFYFRNSVYDDQEHAVEMRVTVFGPADSIDSAQKELRTALARMLDLLTFVSHSRFQILRAHRLVEWDPGVVTRNFKMFHTVDSRHPPEPELQPQLALSAVALDQTSPPEFVRAALKHFRHGLLESQPEDQFMRLWIALEIVAENRKDSVQVPITCGRCGTALSCTECGIEQTRVPMAKQAIAAIIESVAGTEAAEVSKRQFGARNGLIHGRSAESIAMECGRQLHELVDELGAVTWNAIMTVMPSTQAGLELGHRGGEFSAKTLVMSMNGQFDHKDGTPQPADDKIPNVEIELLTRFRSQPKPPAEPRK